MCGKCLPSARIKGFSKHLSIDTTALNLILLIPLNSSGIQESTQSKSTLPGVQKAIGQPGSHSLLIGPVQNSEFGFWLQFPNPQGSSLDSPLPIPSNIFVKLRLQTRVWSTLTVSQLCCSLKVLWLHWQNFRAVPGLEGGGSYLVTKFKEAPS